MERHKYGKCTNTMKKKLGFPKPKPPLSLSLCRGRLSLSWYWADYGPDRLWTSTIWFITLPLGCHNYTGIVIRFGCCLIKTLPGKTQWDKTMVKKKEYNTYYSPCSDHHWRSFSLRITFWCVSFLNVELGSDLVNRSAELSLERIWTTWTSPAFCNSWVKKNLGKVCFVLSPLM